MLYPNPQIYHHLKTIFVHVPKTAGTSIERHLRQSDKDVVGGHTTVLAYRREYPKEFEAYYKFTVVRHPKAAHEGDTKLAPIANPQVTPRFSPIWPRAFRLSSG